MIRNRWCFNQNTRKNQWVGHYNFILKSKFDRKRMKLRKLNTLYNYLSDKLGCHPLFVTTELIRWSDSLEFCVWPQQNDLYFPCLIYDHKTISLSYRSFVSCRTWFSQIFSYIIQLRKKKIPTSCCNFIIRNYIKINSVEIRTMVMSLYTWKIPNF